MKITRAIVAGVAAFVALAGCSSDEDGDQPVGASTSATGQDDVTAADPTPPRSSSPPPTLAAQPTSRPTPPPFDAWAADAVAANPEWCADVDGYQLLRDAWIETGSLDRPDPTDVQEAFRSCPEPDPTPEPTDATPEAVRSFRVNLGHLVDGGYCDTYPASGDDNTAQALAGMFPAAAEFLTPAEMLAMLENRCADN